MDNDVSLLSFLHTGILRLSVSPSKPATLNRPEMGLFYPFLRVQLQPSLRVGCGA